MGTPFKMAGFSGFGNSPMKQDKGKQLVTKSTPRKEKFKLMTNKVDGVMNYYKVSTDGTKTKISESTYNSLKSK
jgi:hypothetical protein